jgi:hypothetical protein
MYTALNDGLAGQLFRPSNLLQTLQLGVLLLSACIVHKLTTKDSVCDMLTVVRHVLVSWYHALYERCYCLQAMNT